MRTYLEIQCLHMSSVKMGAHWSRVGLQKKEIWTQRDPCGGKGMEDTGSRWLSAGHGGRPGPDSRSLPQMD